MLVLNQKVDFKRIVLLAILLFVFSGAGPIAAVSATSAETPNCRVGMRCKEWGECTFRDKVGCVPGNIDDCRNSETCRRRGQCGFKGGCIALSDADCSSSTECKEFGNCHLRGIQCAPKDDSDCAQSEACQKRRLCLSYSAANSLAVDLASVTCVRNKVVAAAQEGEAACQKAKGRWMGTVQGRGRLTGCLTPTKDKGKACEDSKQCESVCVNHKCYEWSDYRGCGIIQNGKVICVD